MPVSRGDATDPTSPHSNTPEATAALERDLRQRYGIDLDTLTKMYASWSMDGVPKSVVEARFLRTRRSHGKLFSRLVRTYLGIETEAIHPLVQQLGELRREVAYLRDLLDEAGIDVPDMPVTTLDPNQLALFDTTTTTEDTDAV